MFREIGRGGEANQDNLEGTAQERVTSLKLCGGGRSCPVSGANEAEEGVENWPQGPWGLNEIVYLGQDPAHLSTQWSQPSPVWPNDFIICNIVMTVSIIMSFLFTSLGMSERCRLLGGWLKPFYHLNRREEFGCLLCMIISSGFHALSGAHSLWAQHLGFCVAGMLISFSVSSM